MIREVCVIAVAILIFNCLADTNKTVSDDHTESLTASHSPSHLNGTTSDGKNHADTDAIKTHNSTENSNKNSTNASDGKESTSPKPKGKGGNQGGSKSSKKTKKTKASKASKAPKANNKTTTPKAVTTKKA